MLMLMFATSAILSGCTLFGGVNTGGLQLDEIVVKNVSVVDGITVAVRGVDCTFSFTTDRQTIFDEVSDCLITHATTAFVPNGIQPLVTSAGAVPLPVTGAVESMKPEEVQSIDNATDLILAVAKAEVPK